jgi:hypothetical protein
MPPHLPTSIGDFHPPTMVAAIPRLHVIAVQTPQLSSIQTGVIFAISGDNWAPHADITVTFEGLAGHVPDPSWAGPTLTADSIGSARGYWGLEEINDLIGPTVAEQNVTAAGPSGLNPATTSTATAVIEWR